MKKQPVWIPWAVLGLSLVYLIAMMFPRDVDRVEFDLLGFSELPVQNGGRIQPMDTFARVHLMNISQRMSAHHATYVPDAQDPEGELEKDGFTISPTKWVLDTLLGEIREKAGEKNPAYDYRIFRIDNDQVVHFLKLQPRPGSWRYSWNEIRDHQGFWEQVERLKEQEGPRKDDIFENKIAELWQRVMAFLKIPTLQIRVLPPEGDRKQSSDADWLTLAAALRDGNDHRVLTYYRSMALAYDDNKPAEFNKALAECRKHLERARPSDYHAAHWEAFFNRFAPFYHASILYGLVFVLGVVSWLVWQKPLQTAAIWLAILVLVVHTWALIMRIYLTGRPPVTNLYSSAVFIGWGCVGLGLVLEWIFKNGIGIVVAGFTGMVSLIIAHNLVSGDTMEMLQAVLDTNFWLATHVICITKGYTATLVAGCMGIAYVLLGIFTDKLREDGGKTLAKMIYGVVCFATLLSFVGTVLGGIWADESWGRFWGWDPKENGALLLVVWNALILHARWGGMIKGRGLAVLAIFGNCVTLWSWFGTNMLGVGLHAYGGAGGLSAGALWVIGAVIGHLILIGLGNLPLKDWKSFARPLQADNVALDHHGVAPAT